MNNKFISFTSASALLAFGLAFSAPAAHAQSTPMTSQGLDFSQLSMQNVAPARLQLKNLNKGWNRLSIENGDDNPYTAIYGFRGAMYDDALEAAGVGVYFTQGKSVTLGGETFLIAYRVDHKMTAQEIQDLFRNFGGHGDDGPTQGERKFAPNTTLLLSLLNLRTVGSLKDIRPFDPKREIMGASDIIAASNANLESLGRSLVQFTNQNRYGQQQLPLQSPQTLRQTFNAYFHTRPTTFVHPQTKEPYRVNTAVAKTPNRLINNKAKIVAIYEGTPGTDGKYGTVFLDGHVERVPASRWKAVRAVLPQKPGPLEVRRMSDTNLRQLRQQVVRYTQRRGGMLPEMGNSSVVRRDLINYTGAYNATYFNHPLTREAYRPNKMLSRKNLRQIANQQRLVAFYEVKPDSRGNRTAIFLDGHIERVPASKWNKVIGVTVRMKPATKQA